MKRYSIIISVFFFTTIILSCKEEKEEDPAPDPRVIIIGTWFCDEREISDTVVYTYKVTISALTGTTDELVLNNFGNLHANVQGFLNGDSVMIPSQTFQLIKIEGQGSILNANMSNWEYTMIIQGDTLHFLAGFQREN